MLLKHDMDRASIKKMIWKVAKDIMAGHKIYGHKIYVGNGGRITHDITREDLGIQLVRYAEYGIINKECVALFHRDYTVAFERQWPDWDVDDPRDKEIRKLGKVHFYASGDFHRLMEASVLLDLVR